MDRDMQRSAWMCWSVGLCVTSAVLSQTATRPAATTSPSGAQMSAGGVGTIKGNNVHIRSGSDANYYAVTKLNKGDQVKIVGEEFGWLKIESPMGTFSVVDKTRVDKVADKKGILNGSAQVYAGSNIDERRYAKQVKLAKGAEVQLLGETSDGAFYKIEPPAGAHVWVKGDFVDRGAGAGKGKGSGLETVPPGELTDSGTAKSSTASKTARNPGKKPAVVLKPAPSNDLLEKYQMQINALETEIAAEGTKPLTDRKFEPIITRLQPIADQTEDELSQIYAKTRIEQLKGQIEMIEEVNKISQLREVAITTADEIARERARIRRDQVKMTDTIVVRGSILSSGIYPGTGNLPKRWRIVEPTDGDANASKTIAYLEVPEGSGIDPAQYYGKFVGIRATSHKILRGTIPPVPIYTVREIVLNPPAEERDDVLSTREQTSSPVPVVVTEPTSQRSSDTETTQPARK